MTVPHDFDIPRPLSWHHAVVLLTRCTPPQSTSKARKPASSDPNQPRSSLLTVEDGARNCSCQSPAVFSHTSPTARYLIMLASDHFLRTGLPLLCN